MSEIRVSSPWAPVPNSFTEVAPATMVGQFAYTFDGVGPQAPIYIRPGQWQQQDYLNIDGAEWLLYTRAVMSYEIQWTPLVGAVAGATLVVENSSAGVWEDAYAFHVIAEEQCSCHQSGIELSGLVARFRLLTANSTVGASATIRGSIIVRAM